MTVRIFDADVELGTNKTLCDYKLTSIKPQALVTQLKWCRPHEISSNIAEPDILVVDIHLPGLIVDSRDYERLDPQTAYFELDCPPQYE